MLLAIDAGNSQTNACLFDADRIEQLVRAPTQPDAAAEALIGELAAGAAVDAAVICTAGPQLDRAYRELIPRLLGREPLVLEAGPVGPDRLADCAAAHAMTGGACIAVDLGTATTVNAVDEAGQFLGGAIAPGLELSARALAERTARLGAVPLEAPAGAIGRDTETAMRSGIVFGHAGLVDGLVERVRADLGASVPAIATGGWAGAVIPHCASVSRVEPALTLHGLRILWERAVTAAG